MQNYFYNPCIAYCALSASDNSRVGVATLLYVTYWFYITNQYNHYKNNFAHLLRQKPIKTLVVSSNLGVLLMALIRLYLSKLNAVASNPIRSGARTTWRYQQVKYQPSAKKMVKPKQVITFVLLLERSDGFLLCGVDAHRERKIQCDPRFGHLPFTDKNRKNTFEMKRSCQTLPQKSCPCFDAASEYQDL